ncbi:MAG: OmpA family protein, partial [Proteobacteria bacterium]|nr:OmpA family protein [Pseudomonadota bacterium]
MFRPGRKSLFSISGIGVLLFALTGYSQASEHSPRKGQVFITPFAAYLGTTDDMGLEGHDTGPVIGIGYALSENWAIEGLYFKNQLEADGTDDTVETKTTWLNLLYSFDNKGDRWQPYTTFGGGRIEFFDAPASFENHDIQLNGGVGFFSNFSKRVGFRGDVRAVWSEDASSISPMALLGMTVTLGRIPDSTPVVVAAAVPVDSDGDGVSDNNDRCPGTPAGARVDAYGCELDDDRDGVVNSKDECPDTEAGAKVDEKGCYLMLEETVTIDLKLEFGVNSADLTPAHASEINTVVDFLKAYPGTDAIIEGHTDSTGAADYNQGLSERRANSVREYLVSKGVNARRLSAVGYGETKPIDTNDTPV